MGSELLPGVARRPPHEPQSGRARAAPGHRGTLSSRSLCHFETARCSLLPTGALMVWRLPGTGGCGSPGLCGRQWLVWAWWWGGRAGQGGPSPVSGFSRKQSSCELGLSSKLSFYSHLRQWVCLAWALVFRFLRGSSYFGICLDDTVAARWRRAVAGAAGALLELSAAV